MNGLKRLISRVIDTRDTIREAMDTINRQQEEIGWLNYQVERLENDLALLQDMYRGKRGMLKGHRDLLHEIVMSDKTQLTPDIVSKSFDLLERSSD